MGIFPVEFPTTTADRFESFRLLHYLAFIKGGLHGRTSRDAFKAMKPGYTFFELYKKTIVFFKPKLLTNKHYEDTDGTGNNSPYYFNCYLVYFGIDFIAGTSCFTYIG